MLTVTFLGIPLEISEDSGDISKGFPINSTSKFSACLRLLVQVEEVGKFFLVYLPFSMIIRPYGFP